MPQSNSPKSSVSHNPNNYPIPPKLIPLFENRNRYKGAKGGRGSGKSHFFAWYCVLAMVNNPNINIVCIREIQKSLKFSAKKLIEDKIKELGVSSMFEVTLSEVRSVYGSGVMIFQGMQDHTAESIKSLEGFEIAWVEESQSISSRSMELLLPTIRSPNSEIWFSWNPNQEDDPVEQLFDEIGDDGMCIHINFTENQFCPDELIKEAERHKRVNPDSYDHVWLGGFNTKSEKVIFNGKFRVGEINTKGFEPMYGLDFGFSQDPTAAVEMYLVNRTLYIRREAFKIGLELDNTADFIERHIPGMSKHVVRADCARPESISYLRRHGMPRITACKKWSGSVEDGIEFIKSLDEIVIHPDCPNMHQEARKYSYKVHKQTGDILPAIEDDNNHGWDGIRYGLGALIKPRGAGVW